MTGSGRTGASLAELLVALTVLALGGGLSVQLLLAAARDLEGAELGLRAALLLSELHDRHGDRPPPGERPVGPGRFAWEPVEGGGVELRFRPLREDDGRRPASFGYGGGFRESRSWVLETAP